MSTSYPSALDSFTDPTSASSEQTLSHAAQHDNENDSIAAIEAFLGITSQQQAGGVQYVSTTGNDSNSGLTWGQAKLTVGAAITALGSGGGTIELGVGTINLTTCTPAASTKIRGRGKGATTLKINTDAGSGHYGIDCSASQMATPITIESLELAGPGNGAFTIGVAPANMSGVKSGSKMIMRDVYVQGFYAGIEITSDHESFYSVKSSNNFYNVYETATLSSIGNQTFVGCDFTGATRASIAVSSNGQFDTVTFVQCHAGFAPVGIYQEAFQTGGRPSTVTNSWCDLQFEACGNACILDSAPTTACTTLVNVTFIEPVFSAAGTGTYYDNTISTTAAVNVNVSSFRIIGDRTTAIGGTTAIFSNNPAEAGSQSILITDRAPIANEFNGSWLGSKYHDVLLINGSLASATVCSTIAAVTQGQVLQQQGQAAAVRPFGSDNSYSYIGIAATSAAASSQVAVWTEGNVNVLCSTHVSSAIICRLEIDPATPSQVRVVNEDLGTQFAPTTQVPSRYPVIGHSNAQNSGTNTLIQCHLNSPYIDPGYVNPAPVSALPSAGAGYVGQMLMVPGNHTSTADILYVCLESSTGTYSWKQVVSG